MLKGQSPRVVSFLFFVYTARDSRIGFVGAFEAEALSIGYR